MSPDEFRLWLYRAAFFWGVSPFELNDKTVSELTEFFHYTSVIKEELDKAKEKHWQHSLQKRIR